MSDFFCGFQSYIGRVPSPVCGESYKDVEILTRQDDDICIADVVRRMQRGEIVPLKQLPYGEEEDADHDIVDTEEELRRNLAIRSEVSKSDDKNDGELPNSEEAKLPVNKGSDRRSTDTDVETD